MNENIELIETEEIQNLIYTIRGKQVMLDSDVAMLYHYETKRINEIVKRNQERFPENFYFQLTETEVENLRSQIATSSLDKVNYGGRRYLPYVYTEQGIAMLSGLLKNNIAIQVSINIINAFVNMRHFLKDNGKLLQRVSNLEYQQIENNRRFDIVFDQLQKKQIEEQKIFFQGQIWDSYSLIIDLVQKANKKIVIIDNYVDKTILDMLTKKKEKTEVVIITSTNNKKIQNIDIKKFNIQYPTLKLARKDLFHDRFIIIDNQELYHCGASIKDLGKKCFGINKIEDKKYLEEIVKII